jgi:thiol-disulfide isomerase/thioredoxin
MINSRLGSLVAQILLVAVLSFTRDAPAGWLQAMDAPQPAPRLALEDIQERTWRLQDLTGKVVLVNFWATWCSPCLEEMPSLKRLQAAMSDSRLIVLGVNVEEPLGRVRRFVKRLGIEFPTLIDADGTAYRDWGIKVYPASFLVDGAGRVRYQALGPISWDEDEAMEAVRGLLQEIGEGPP